jgi:hypothetical protein
MKFIYRTFNIECFVRITNGNYVGQATISRLPSDAVEGKSFDSGFLRACSTEEKALGYARNFAEMWCDENFI